MWTSAHVRAPGQSAVGRGSCGELMLGGRRTVASGWTTDKYLVDFVSDFFYVSGLLENMAELSMYVK